jgi:hypothetical protein
VTTQIKANFLYADCDEDNGIMVGFADDQFDTKEHLLLQKSLFFDEKDRERGFDKVYINYGDQINATYGGVLKFVLKNGTAQIYLDSKAANELNTDEQIEIIFPKNDDKLRDAKKYLAEIFKDEMGVFVSEI